MSQTKKVPQGINWLDAIDGLTVADAIDVLKTFDQTFELHHWLEGDTHGADIECDVYKVVPLTKEEIKQQKIDYWKKRMADNERYRDYYVKKGRTDMLGAIDKAISECLDKIAKIESK